MSEKAIIEVRVDKTPEYVQGWLKNIKSDYVRVRILKTGEWVNIGIYKVMLVEEKSQNSNKNLITVKIKVPWLWQKKFKINKYYKIPNTNMLVWEDEGRVIACLTKS